MKYATIFAAALTLTNGVSADFRKLQHPGVLHASNESPLRRLMTTKPYPEPTKPAVPEEAYKGKGSSMSYKGKGKGGYMMRMGKGKGGTSMSKGKSSMSSKGMSMMSYKGKGSSSSKGMSSSSKGKGSSSSMSMMSYKGKGSSSSKGMSSSYKGKGGEPAKGKGMSSSYKGKGGEPAKGKGSSSSKGMSSSYKGKGGEPAKGKGGESYKGKGGEPAKGKGKGADLPTLADIVATTEDLSVLYAALEASGLLEFFYDYTYEYTVLAPINSAFDTLAAEYPELFAVLFDKYWILHLVDILTMHVTEPAVLSTDLTDGQELEMFNLETVSVEIGEGVCFSPSVTGSSCVALADVMAKNGVAHVVDDVIAPFWFEFTVADIVSGLPETSTLLSLVECANLTDTLATTMGLTVFAPTNDAFAGADAEYLCSQEGLPTLIDVLTYHVLPMPLPSLLLEEGKTDYKTLQGSDATITYYPDEKYPEKTVLTINDANIIDIDYGARNGIVHVIDTILFPPAPPSKGKGAAPSKGKGAAPSKGKGKGSSSSYKGKGSSYKGKGSSSSGKGSSSSSYKGKGKGY